MRTIKLKFVDFWPGLNEENNYFINLLRRKYDVKLSDNPEMILYSVFGSKHKKYKCYKIFYTGENVRPNFDECDFAFTFDHLDRENHYRLPIYALSVDLNKLVKHDAEIDKIMSQKTKFCNFIYSNPKGKKRIEFFERLSKYKRIDSAGRVKNNMGQSLGFYDKVEFIKQYKFTIAFENSAYPGYTTEKLTDPMWANSLPIYWGNELVHLDFNPQSFLNYYDFPSEEKLIERIIELDQNDDLYRRYMLEPYYYSNKINSLVTPESVLEQFEKIIENPHFSLKSHATDMSSGIFKFFSKR